MIQAQLKKSGSLNELANDYTKSFISKLSNAGSESLLIEEFDPISSLEDLTKKRVMKYLILFKTKGKDIKFEDLWKPLMNMTEETMYLIYDEIIDGFKGGEPDLMQWVKNNIMRISTEGLE